MNAASYLWKGKKLSESCVREKSRRERKFDVQGTSKISFHQKMFFRSKNSASVKHSVNKYQEKSQQNETIKKTLEILYWIIIP